MKFIIRLLALTILVFGLFSCGGEEQIRKNFEDLVGTYDCLKITGFPLDSTFAVQQDLVVEADPDNEDHLLISNLSIPIDENGAFGPAELNPSMNIELYFEDDEISFTLRPILINGIALPCTFKGRKIE